GLDTVQVMLAAVADESAPELADRRYPVPQSEPHANCRRFHRVGLLRQFQAELVEKLPPPAGTHAASLQRGSKPGRIDCAAEQLQFASRHVPAIEDVLFECRKRNRCDCAGTLGDSVAVG